MSICIHPGYRCQASQISQEGCPAATQTPRLLAGDLCVAYKVCPAEECSIPAPSSYLVPDLPPIHILNLCLVTNIQSWRCLGAEIPGWTSIPDVVTGKIRSVYPQSAGLVCYLHVELKIFVFIICHTYLLLASLSCIAFSIAMV